MRIGIDCRLWSESGVGRYTRNLVGYLQKIDTKNEYILFVLSKDLEQIKSEIKNSKFEIVRADIRWHSFEEQWKFSTVLVQQKLDLVHFPYFSLPVSYPGKFIVTIHDLILHHFPTGQASTLNPLFYWIKLLGYKYIVYKAAKKAKRIITVTEATKKEIVQHLGITPQKIEVTYEGIDRKISTKSEASNLQKNPNYFLYVGNAYPHKNLEKLLEAFSVFHLKNQEIFLKFVGKEDYFYKRIKGIVSEMSLTDCVQFEGEVTDSELSTLYKNARGLVIPSLMEGFGLPVLEAMASGCPIACSRISSHEEICKDAAFYFDPKNPNDIADSMSEIISNTKEVKEHVSNGLQRSKSFSFEKMAKQTLAIYIDAAA